MSEKTPERLKEFRAGYEGRPKAGLRMAWLHLLILVVGFGGLYWMLAPTISVVEAPGRLPDTAEAGLPVEALREYAAALAEKNLPDAAVDVYKEYLARAPLTRDERAKVCYAVAKLATEAERYETALAYLYQAEWLAPDSDVKDEIDKKVALCLDKLGRTVDLRRELRKRTDVSRNAEDVKEGETILAEFGDQVITDRDLELELEKLPSYMRPSLSSPEQKVDFLKNVVANRLLVDKARRLELDKDPEIQDRLTAQLDRLMVSKLIADEVAPRINITPEDIERFYKAEIKQFTQPATATVRIGKAGSAKDAAALNTFPEGPVVVRQDGNIQGVPPAAEAVETLFATEPGQTAGPLEIQGTWYVFKVESKTPEKVLPFEEVKDKAGQLLRLKKEQEQVGLLIEETLQSQDVHVYPQRLAEMPSTQ